MATHYEAISEIVNMLSDTGQIDLIAESVEEEGRSIEQVAHSLVTRAGWTCDEDDLVEAIERGLAERAAWKARSNA